jgi:Ca2+-binding RTX toxin-like protein
MSLKTRAVALIGFATMAFCAITTAALADSGGLDAGYGSGGKMSLPASLGTTTVGDSAVATDGSLFIVGRTGTTPNRNVFVAKFTSAGVLDASFGTNGVTTFDAGGDDVANGVSIRSNGGVVIVGSDNEDYSNGVGFVAETLGNGTPDPAWGTNGITDADDGGALLGSMYRGIEASPGGDVVYIGISQTSTFNFGRIQSNGAWTAINGFYGAFGTTNVRGLGLFLRSDGDWEALTAASDGVATEITVTIFNGATAVTTTQAQTPVAADVVLRKTLSMTGNTMLLTGATGGRGTLWRFATDGTLDTTFGTAGALQLPAASDPWVASGVAQETSGKWYVAGDLGTDRVRTLHLNGDFSLETSFATGGIADRSYGAATRVDSVFLDSAGRPLETGSIGTAAAAWRVERFNYAAFQLGKVTYSPSFVQRLNTVTFNYSVKNTGPDMSGVTVDIDVPSTFEGQTYSTTSGSATPVADGSGATWTVPQLAPGATATLTLTGRPGDAGTLTTTASVTGQTTLRAGDAPAAQSTSVTVFGAGTPRDDVITGTPGRDIIDALQGDDIVHALAGNDWINGNDGNDKLYGENGNDVVLGGSGTDLVDGGNGKDTLDGGAGNDHVLGRAGDDKASGGAGNDVVDGGVGNDKVAGGSGNDRLYGRIGNDRLNSGAGNDLIFAGAGNDAVFGGTGADRLYGESGNDYLIAQGSGDKLYGGPGRDRLDGGAANDKIYGGTGADWINGKTGNDVMNGNAGNDWIRGFSGKDLLIGSGGDDLLNGGSGRDTFRAGSGDDIVRADDGFGGDVINCGSGWDLVYANPGDRVASNCEYVKYDVPAGTRFSGHRGTGAVAAFARHHG